ncbi:MAG TPA: hypothetical protein VFX59_27680, partial [Polyangiales bacterium]|nr:hypothetical protein [Polyangiales bacterium]
SAAPRALTLFLLASLSLAALPASSARACAGEATARWVPQRSWPSACEPDAFLDGAVLLEGDAIPSYTLGGDGELKVLIQRVVDGAPVEDFAGKLSFPDETSALFQADRALPPATDFIVTAYRASIDGTPIGDKFSSAFTTGTRTLAPLALASEPTLSYEESDRKRHSCTTDACGSSRCETSDELVHVRSLRIAVPEITGGVEGKPYRVSAELVATFGAGQAPAVATSDSAVTQADKRSYFVLDLPALPEAAEGCVTIHVHDVSGRVLDSKPTCMKFDPDDAAQPAPSSALGADSQVKITTQGEVDADFEELELSSTVDEATAGPVQASAGGCAIGQTRGGASVVGWLGLALTLARLRPRKRSASL